MNRKKKYISNEIEMFIMFKKFYVLCPSNSRKISLLLFQIRKID